MPPISSRPISGRYRGRHDRLEIELRVDIDGPTAMRQLSADYSYASDGRYKGSMRVLSADVRTTATHVVIDGDATFTWPTSQRRIRVAIPHAAVGAASPPATLQHYTAAGGKGASCRCAFVSAWFRTVQLEEAVQRDVTKFDRYDTAALPCSGASRELTYVGAFADAGIDMRVALPPALVNTSAAGADAGWSDAELHAAMEQRFTRWADRPEWAIWLIHATHHDSAGAFGPNDLGPSGLMFDRRGAQRQGCAVFYDTMPGTDARRLRTQLYTCVHELAHGFNLVHSWQKSMARPPVPSRPGAASWMNYPQRFPGGVDAFWAAFDFAFDDDELAHLRHAYRDDIVMGGAPFLSNAALRLAPEWATGPAGTADGLSLSLSMQHSYAYGVPVTADLTLSATAAEGRLVHTVLGPRSGTAEIAIARVGGDAHVFEPLLRHCHGGDMVLLRPGDPPVRDHAFLHYGQAGYPFRKPGVFDVQARFSAADGSFALSDVVRIRVLAPQSSSEHAVGSLLYRDGQAGVLLSLVGSDAPELRRGNKTLQHIIDAHPAHPTAAIARLVRGVNAARRFKTIASQGSVGIREPQPERAFELVEPVIDVARLNAAVRAATAAGGGRREVAAAMSAVGTRPGVDPSVRAYLGTRLAELVTVLPVIAAVSPPRPYEPDPPPQHKSWLCRRCARCRMCAALVRAVIRLVRTWRKLRRSRRRRGRE